MLGNHPSVQALSRCAGEGPYSKLGFVQTKISDRPITSYMLNLQFQTVDALFRDSVRRSPKKVFLRSADCRGDTTYAQAAIRVAETIHRLQQLGFVRGDKIIIYADDVVDSIYLLLAAFHLGVLPIPLAPSFSVDYIRGVAKRTEAKGFWARAIDAARLQQSGLPTVCLDVQTNVGLDQAFELMAAVASHHGVQDALVITPTSGSTGEPKLPIWSHAQLQRAGHNLCQALGWTSQDPGRALVANALTHGLGLTLLSAILEVGAEACIPSQRDVNTPLCEARELDFTYSFMTPRVIRSLHQQYIDLSDSSEPFLGPSVRAIGFAGAPPPVELFPFLEEHGIEPVDIWGSSETGNVAGSTKGDWRSGLLRPFDGIDISRSTTSELMLRASHLFLGYYGDEASTAKAYTSDGQYHSGDVGELTPEGLLHLTGRVADVFNTFEGSNVYPGRIENMLEAIPLIDQAILIGDRRPYCSALLSVKEHIDQNLYATVQAELDSINKKLESIEQVQRFLLHAGPFPSAAYEYVGSAQKAKRNRANIEVNFDAEIKVLYAVRPGDWRRRKGHEFLTYPDVAELNHVLSLVRAKPPLVAPTDVDQLKQELAEAQQGKRFVLQAGDCAETFKSCEPHEVLKKINGLLHLSNVLTQGMGLPVTVMGRMAGQYAKPRSSLCETRIVDGVSVTLPSYLGDLVNDVAFTAEARRFDVRRLLRAAEHAALTLNQMRASASSSNVFVCHEGLNLYYESAQIRDGYDLSTHMPWIGERHRGIDGAHVEFYSVIKNPVGVKLGPNSKPDDVLRLCERLNPSNEPGKMVLITRMGATAIERALPPLLTTVRDAGIHVLWVCDPMHGNTYVTAHGTKTRRITDILAEAKSAASICAAAGSWLGGLHLEISPDDVTECVGVHVEEADLHKNYTSACDPRLNPAQSFEVVHSFSQGG